MRPSPCNIFKVLPEVSFFFLFAPCDVPCSHNEHITRKFFFLRSILPHSVQVWIGIEMKGEEEKWWLCSNFARSETRNRWTEHDTKQKLRSDKEWNYSNYDKKKGIGTMSNNAEANFSAHTTIIFFSSFSLTLACVGSFSADVGEVTHNGWESSAECVLAGCANGEILAKTKKWKSRTEDRARRDEARWF